MMKPCIPAYCCLALMFSIGLCYGSEIQFNATTFTAAEGTTAKVTVTLTGTNGSQGVVKVDYCAFPGAFDTASGLAATSAPNGDFAPYVSRIRGVSLGGGYQSDVAASGTIVFNPGETVKTFSIPIQTDGIVEGDETITLYLRNPQGAALGAPADAKLIIKDIDAPAAGVLQFSSPLNHVASNAGMKTITVTRTGGSTGAVSVTYATSAVDVTYRALGATTDTIIVPHGYLGLDYNDIVPSTLSWADGDTSPKTFAVPILGRGAAATGIKNVGLTLSSATGGAALGTCKTADLYIVYQSNTDIYNVCCRRAAAASPSWAPQPPVVTGGPMSAYIPRNVAVLRGLLLTSGPNVQTALVQNICKFWGFAAIQCDAQYMPPELEEPVGIGYFEDIVAQFAAGTNHPELINCPFVAEGGSSAASTPVDFSMCNCDRALGFNAMIGGHYRNESGYVADPYERIFQHTPMPSGARSVPGLFIDGELDVLPDKATNNTPRNVLIETYWTSLRSQGGLVGFLTEWNTSHNGSGGQMQEMRLYFIDQAMKVRNPNGILPGMNPGERPTLATLTQNSMWLADKPTLYNTASSQFLNIAPAAQYTGVGANACCFPTEAAAIAGRAHSSLNMPMQGSVPYQTPLAITSPAANQILAPGTIQLVVTPRTLTNISTMEYYDGNVKLGQLSAPQTSWNFTANFASGIHSVSVLATDTGNKKYVSYRVFICDLTGVTPPSITTQPASQSVNAGQPVTLIVAATGTAALRYQWRKNGTNIASTTAATFTIASAQASDAADYTVVVENVAGNVVSTVAKLTVVVVAAPPTIITQPASQTVTSGQPAAFSVAVNGTAPFTYQWMKNGVNIAGATSATYSIAAAQSSDAGTYSVKVTNTAGSVTSNGAALTVNPASVAPAITQQPASQIVTAGQPAAFSVTVNGTAPFTYLWMKNGVNIAGATSATYSIAAAQSNDAGTYSVKVTNTAGSVTSNGAALTVNPASVAPTITQQPASQTVTAGQSAPFSVVANGTAPLSYQWFKNGIAISGATSATFTIASAQGTDAGTYMVKVSNSAGNVSSNGAVLTVKTLNVAPSITSQSSATPNPVYVGATVAFTVAATDPDGDPLSYSWSFGDGTTAIGSSAQHIYTSAGSYNATVTISDGALSVNSTVVVSVVQASDPTLLANYMLDEKGGLTAADSSGNSNIGTLVNNPVWTAGKVNGGLLFHGTDYVDCGNKDALNPASQITLCGWINSSDGAPATEEIVAKDNNTLMQYYLRIQAGGKLRFGIAGTLLNGVTVLKANTWYFVAGTYDGSQMNVYINGVLDATLAKTGPMVNNGVNVLIGARKSATLLNFMGVLDEIRIYGRALSLQELQSLQTTGTTLSSAPGAATAPTIMAPAAQTATVELTVNKLRAHANLVRKDRDVCGLGATLPTRLSVSNAHVLIDAGGASQQFTLNSNGVCRTASGTITLKTKKSKSGNKLVLLATFKHGNWAGAWIPTESSGRLQVSVTINEQVFTAIVNGHVASNPGKTWDFSKQ
jgi:hypothetical protein